MSRPRRPEEDEERRPLLDSDNSSFHENSDEGYASTSSPAPPSDREDDGLISFGDDDPQNPRAWSEKAKLTNVAIIAIMAILSPLASSMFSPGIQQIADGLNTKMEAVVATTTGFVIMMGFGPLILAPLSETFGRRKIYIICFSIFTLLQIPAALAPNIATLITARTIAGFFGSVGLANGGGTLSDMYPPSRRAGVFGWYLLGPLLGPTLGPVLGGVIITRLEWRWIFWVLLIVGAAVTAVGYFFLRETYVPVLLSWHKASLLANQKQNGSDATKYHFEDEDTRPVSIKLRHSLKRPLVIFVQPIVLVMSGYQAIVFGTTYSIFTNMQEIFGKEPYSFDSEKVGLLYLGPGLGFLTAVWFLVPRIDTVFNKLTEKNNGKAEPEFRLPLANIGSVLIPLSLFCFAWTVEYRLHWAIIIAATFFYGVGQVMILNTVQNYYIDSFEKYAASAIAGGSVFRSLLGGVTPLFAPTIFSKLGYGWGVSVFAFLTVLIAPSPLIFYYYGERVRERYQITFK